MTRTLTRLAAAAATLSLATPAFAHSGFHAAGFQATGFMAGLAHPFSGLDHLLVMMGVGIWAVQLGERYLWAVPLAFVATMLAGAVLALAAFPLPLVEIGIAGSVVAIGLLIGLGARLPGPLTASLVALMALFHGHAHGTELPDLGLAQGSADLGTTAWGYAAGFVLSTATLHMIGLGLGMVALGRAKPFMLKAAGALTALIGLAMVSGA